MMEELTNIWNTDDELNEEQLLNYINNKATDENAHTIEEKMAASSFVNDGVEGLQQFSASSKINSYVQQINEDLHHKLSNKKIRNRKKLKGLSWELITIIVVILLCILGYAIIEMMR
jgi:CHASE3 domain sensor protein